MIVNTLLKPLLIPQKLEILSKAKKKTFNEFVNTVNTVNTFIKRLNLLINIPLKEKVFLVLTGIHKNPFSRLHNRNTEFTGCNNPGFIVGSPSMDRHNFTPNRKSCYLQLQLFTTFNQISRLEMSNQVPKT